MTGSPADGGGDLDRRRRAEQRAAENAARAAEDLTELSPGAAVRLVHELRVHQIELEMQNEELRRSQGEIEAARVRYFDLYDNAPIGYLSLGEGGLIVMANLTAATMLGMPRANLVGSRLRDHIVPEDQDAYYRHGRALAATRRAQACELRLRPRNGESRWVRLEATPEPDAPGADQCRVVILDIGIRRRADEALQASEARHRVLFEMSHDALLTLTPSSGQITAGNSAAVALFGASDEKDLVARSPGSFWPERQPDGSPSADGYAAMIAATLRDGSHSFDWVYRRLGGPSFPTTVLLTRVQVDEQILVQATVRDLTETRRLQAEVAQADRLASMGMLAAGVVHEISNPLAAALVDLECVARDLSQLADATNRGESSDREARELRASAITDATHRVQDAVDCAKRIRRITHDLSSFARVDRDESAVADLHAAIRSAASIAHNVLRYRAQLVLDLGTVPMVRASEGKLVQVFVNLFVNAAHAIVEGEPERNRVTVKTSVHGDLVVTEVVDTGSGIAAADLERVFEPFFTTSHPGEGAGLGLAICRKIVAGLGGKLAVESELGRGSRFLVRLPIAPAETDVVPATMNAESAPARGRILVVDDEDPLRRALVRLLCDHEVVAVGSGDAARRLLETDPTFDVILCDLMMAGMSGMALHAWLVARDPEVAARVVFMTGGAFTPRSAEYVAKVENVLIEKPFDSAMLLELVARRVRAARVKA